MQEGWLHLQGCARSRTYKYSSTAELVAAGVKPMPDVTMGEAYARLLVMDAMREI